MMWLFVVLALIVLTVVFVAGWLLCAAVLVTTRREVADAAAAVAVDRAGLEAQRAILMHTGDAFLAIRRGTDVAP